MDEYKKAKDRKKSTESKMESSDSSDEEDLRNTVGNIPMRWYDSYDHVGYDLSGQKIIRTLKRDEIDEFLAKMEDPNYWKTVHDPQLDKPVVLSDEAIETIRNIQAGRFPMPGYDPYQAYVDFFTYQKSDLPVCCVPSTKRSFVPSRVERRKVSQLVRGMKLHRQRMVRSKRPKKVVQEFFDLWAEERTDPLSHSEKARMKMRIPAPKMKLPGDEESYNPPSEYLFTEEEEQKWRHQATYERRLDFIPQKFAAMRHVPAYKRFMKERYERCMDLYLAPRQRKERLNVDPNDLLPKLPKPSELRPFPTTEMLIYRGHQGPVCCLDLNTSGDYLVSGSEDGTVRFWDVSSGRCLKVNDLKQGQVHWVAWCPNEKLSLVAVAVASKVILLNGCVGSKSIVSDTDAFLENVWETMNDDTLPRISVVNWQKVEDKTEYAEGSRLSIIHRNTVRQVTWHSRGDYFASVVVRGGNSSVLVHQMSKLQTQIPLAKNKGEIRRVLFHPLRPYIFVATDRMVRVYNLAKQQLTKKLSSTTQRICDMAVHPKGDNLILGGSDARLNWFDLDLSRKPYKTLTYHNYSIMSVAFHLRYPLFASSSDDASTQIFHGMVYNDYLQNPLIVPLKILRGHHQVDQRGTLHCIFHPYQPWIFTSGADTTIRLYT